MIIYRRNKQARRTAHYKGKRSSNRFSSGGLYLMIGLLMGILACVTLYSYLNGKWTMPINNKAMNSKAKPTVHIAQAHAQKHLTHVPEPPPIPESSSKITKPDSTKTLKEHGPRKELTQRKKPAQRFEFYQLLPGMEVPIPDIDNPNKTLTNASKDLPALTLANTTTAPLAKSPTHTPPLPTATMAQQLAYRKPSGKKSDKKNSKSTPKVAPVKPPAPSLAKTQVKLAAAQYLIQAGTYRSLSAAEMLRSRLAAQGFKPRIQKIEAEDGVWFRVTLGPFPSETMALNQKNRLAKQKIHGILILQRQRKG